MFKGALVFLAMFLVDVFWAKYTQAVAENKAIAAANWSAGIILLGALTVVAYTQNQTFLLYAMGGGWLGTYVTIRSKKT
jgi:hypothetical protein